MSDDEADPELLELLRQSLGLSNRPRDELSSDTGVLKDAEFIYHNAIDVSIDMHGTKSAANSIYAAMHERTYSTRTWGQHALHPTVEEGFSEIEIVSFVFTLDLLNFSFWSELSEAERFQVEYKDKRWTGYQSLLACLRRALDEHIPLTTPRFWVDHRCTDELLQHIFRSATAEKMPLLSSRINILREAGQVLTENFGDPGSQLHVPNGDSVHADGVEDNGISTASIHEADSQTIPESIENNTEENQESKTSSNAEAPNASGSTAYTSNHVPSTETEQFSLMEELQALTKPDLSVTRLINKAERSAGKLVNLLVKYFPNFQDEARFDGRRVRLYKRAQIFVADLWAALNGTGYGDFHDIDHLTMFADYRVPQMLRSLGVLSYSPSLEYAIRDRKMIAHGHSWEVQLRGCSIWAVELIRREIVRQHDATNINAVLIDFFLYDLAKEKEASLASPPQPIVAHHLTRSEFY